MEPISESDPIELMESKIKTSREDCYKVIQVRSDGNCLYSSLLKATGKNVGAHRELRLSTADLIEDSDLP